MSRRMLTKRKKENGLMPVTDGLVCWLDGRDGKTGDTIWKDRSGNGNHAVFINNKTVFENGKLTLNGDNYAELPFGKGEDINKHSLCSYFSKIKDPNAGMSISGGLGNNQRKYLDIGDGNFPRMGYCEKVIRANRTTEYNTMIHSVLNSEELIKFYLNGVVVATTPRKEGVALSSNYFIGINDITYENNLFWLKGSIATILVYNRALTEEEIQQNYEYEQSIERG